MDSTWKYLKLFPLHFFHINNKKDIASKMEIKNPLFVKNKGQQVQNDFTTKLTLKM